MACNADNIVTIARDKQAVKSTNLSAAVNHRGRRPSVNYTVSFHCLSLVTVAMLTALYAIYIIQTLNQLFFCFWQYFLFYYLK